MDFSFKLYLAEVEKRDVLGFANLLKKAANNQPVTNTELIDVIKQYDINLKTLKTHQSQIDFANKNKSKGNQMATNLIAATKKPQYDDRIQKAPTVPHFVADLQNDIKGLTILMINSIKELTPDVAKQILMGKYVGNGEITRNIVRYKDNSFVKQALEKVAASAKPKVDYSDFSKYVYVKNPKNFKDAIEDYAKINNTNKSFNNMVTREQMQNLNSINDYIKNRDLNDVQVKAIFEGLKSSYPNAIQTSDGIKLLMYLYDNIDEGDEIIPHDTDLANELFNFIQNLMNRVTPLTKELVIKFNELQPKHQQKNDQFLSDLGLPNFSYDPEELAQLIGDLNTDNIDFDDLNLSNP